MRVRAGLRGEAGELDRLGRRVGTGPGDHRDAACAVLDRHTDELAVFAHGDRGRFAGRADDHDAVGTFGDMPVDEAAQAGEVQAAVVVHGRDDGDKRSGNHGVRQ